VNEFDHVTTDEAVAVYSSATGVFNALLNEVRELSKKKPDATMSPSKVKVINKVLDDLLTFLKDDPEGKYLQRLEDDDLPQVSDALLMMAQFDAALDAFRTRYYEFVNIVNHHGHHWITRENVAMWSAEDGEVETDDDI